MLLHLQFVYTYLLTAFTQVRLLVAKFVVSAFLDYKSLQCRFCLLQQFVVSPFSLQIFSSVRFLGLQMFCSVRFLRLQMFCSIRFSDYKCLQCPLFGTTNVCSLLFSHSVMSLIVHAPFKEVYSRLNRGKGQIVVIDHEMDGQGR